MSYYLGSNEVVIDSLSNIKADTSNISLIDNHTSNIDLEADYLTTINSNLNLIKNKIVLESSLVNVNTNVYNTLSNLTITNTNLNSINSNLDIIKSDVSNLNDIYVYKIYYSPKYQRQSSKVFCAYEKKTISSDTNFIALYNPSGSGKTAYIYNLTSTIAGSDTNKRCRVTYRTTNDNLFSNGSEVTNIVNLDFSSSNTTDMRIRTGTGQTSKNFYSFMLQNNGVSSQTDFQKEFFEIKESVGFIVLIDMLNGTTDVTVSMRWYEL
jgi:hypothetical protein